MTTPTVISQLSPPPRRVRLRPGAWGSVWAPRIGSVAFIALALWAVKAAMEDPLTQWLGRQTTGQIVNVRLSFNDRGGRYYVVTYTYESADHRQRTASSIVDTRGMSRPPWRRDLVGVRALSVGPFHLAVLSQTEYVGSDLMCGGLMPLALCILAAIGTAWAWIPPVRERRLVRDGRAFAGTIEDLSIDIEGEQATVQLVVHYIYDCGDGVKRHGAKRVGRAMYESFEEGQAVTVLCPPECPQKPEKSLLYEAARFEVT